MGTKEKNKEKTGKKVVLIVDDDDDVHDTLTVWLNSRGFSVNSVYNAKSAQSFLKKQVPDLIMMDVMMPDMNGIELCRWVWEQENLKNVPVIQMSAMKDNVTMQDSQDMGSMDYIVKPFDFKLLAQKIETALVRMERRKGN